MTSFARSPYFHIGGDETDWSGFDADPSVRAYKQEKHLDTGRIFTGFLNRIDAIVGDNTANRRSCGRGSGWAWK